MPSWREAATLILAAFKGVPAKGGCNYSLLTLKRSAKSSFMPNGVVFPGGTTELSDGDEKWLKVFQNYKLPERNSKVKNVPPILQESSHSVSKLLLLKIAAVRETFEETGILLCSRPRGNNTSAQGYYESSNSWVSCFTNENLNDWRLRVHEDSSEFLNMCMTLGCIPDVGHIHLWSNWLTPTSMGKKRFDTIFFIAFLRDIPVALADATEIEKVSWISPVDLLKLCRNNEIILPPPQIYETTRLVHFDDVHCLHSHAAERSSNGCDRWMPQQVKTSNGLVSLLPGDGSYRVSDFCAPTKPLSVDCTLEEFRLESQVLHRMEFLDGGSAKVVTKNYKPTDGHVLPVDSS